MSKCKQAVFFFCVEEPHHHVAKSVFERLQTVFALEEAGFSIDGYPVLQHRDTEGVKGHPDSRTKGTPTFPQVYTFPHDRAGVIPELP